VTIERDTDVQMLSVQGPKSLELLAPHAEIELASLAYFNHKPSELFGKNVLIMRGGYAHEQGYEIFCASSDVVELWDTILREGEQFGIMPCSFTTEGRCFFRA